MNWRAARSSTLAAAFSGGADYRIELVAAPVMLAATLAILIESRGRGPVFYKQKRVGRNGQIFEILKFRSMQVGAEKSGKAQWATLDDPRVTRVG